MQLIHGDQIAANTIAALRKECAQLLATIGRPPKIAFVRVGEDPASVSYVTKKRETAAKVGMLTELITPDTSITQAALVQEIEALNADSSIDGILVQTPLPSHIDTNIILSSVDPRKDVDGFHWANAGKLLQDQHTDNFIPCTPFGILRLIDHTGISPAGKHVVIVGRSQIVSKPLAMLFLQKAPWGNATVTVCHSRTPELGEHTRRADILIVAVGQVNLIGANEVKEGAVVIDVGNNRNDAGKLVGDVNFEAVKEKASWITPVPGGVGPMTVTMLMHNTLLAYKRHHGIT